MKCKGLQLSQGNLSINLGWGMNKLRLSLPGRTWGCWWVRGWTWAVHVHLQPRKPTVSWAASRDV